jgi:hypothetical protein
MIHDIAALVYKRSVDFNRDEPEIQLPAWSWAVVLANLVVFLPVIVFVSTPEASIPASKRKSQ